MITPDQPTWQNPSSGNWQDQRIIGRDGRRFGPLPHAWVQYLGLFQNGDRAVIHYRVGDREIHELPGYVEYGKGSVYTRTFRIGPGKDNLLSRLDHEASRLSFHLKGSNLASIVKEEGFNCLKVKASDQSQLIVLGFSMSNESTIASLLSRPVDPLTLTNGGPSRFGQQVIITEGQKGNEDDPFAVDVLTLPNKDQNPWNSWMRLGGFDFFAENPDRAAVCTWMGDVWLVDGVTGDLEELKWRRICSGLFQPLGLKIVDGMIHVACRDQIARLHDLNGDLEIDWIECFNNDHQVTEHFHEFAMGLQTDELGNFYYAKSARHAKTALVPHHGTLLRVSPDGKKTDIVATGFRAANGVCLNPDGTWIVTDQEGHWNPKNRINYVKEGGFYGNMMGYHDIEDSSDSAMQQPLAWITNAFDRSPAELLWVPKMAIGVSSMASCLTLVMDTVWFMLFHMRFWTGRLRVGFALFRLIVCQPVFIEGVSIRKPRIYLRPECLLGQGVNEKMVGFTESVKWRTPPTCQPSWRLETKSFEYGSVTKFPLTVLLP